jgi:hypothetical protein
MKTYFKFIVPLIFIGCGGGGGSISDFNTTTNTNENQQVEEFNATSIDLTNNEVATNDDTILFPVTKDTEVKYIKNVKQADIEVDIPRDKKKSIYVVSTSHFNQSVSLSATNARLTNRVIEDKKEQNTSKAKAFFITPKKILDIRENPPKKIVESNQTASTKRLSRNFRTYYPEDEESFYVEIFDENSNSQTYQIRATAKRVISNVSTAFGNKNLVIWVSNYDLDRGVITQSMVDDLANIFLKEGPDNDIYDWVTNIFGPEWGDDATRYASNLIPNENTIHILIYDMGIEYLAGFFYSQDNYTRSSQPYSNEKIMFYVNSQMYGKGDEASKKETFTTLDHEFQHMINFYQRWVKRNLKDPTWFNELLSETTEDLLSTKIGYKGPRNVDPDDGSAGEPGNDGGRYPYFNKYNYYPVTIWTNNIDDYGRVSALGTFLIRNYGGARFLHDLFYTNATAQEAVTTATQEPNFNTVLQKWGTGVMLSDKTNLEPSLPQYNFGDFKETTLKNITYKMGSINFFNYVPNPTFLSRLNAYKEANIYTKVGDNLSGKIRISVDMTQGGDVAVIVK